MPGICRAARFCLLRLKKKKSRSDRSLPSSPADGHQEVRNTVGARVQHRATGGGWGRWLYFCYSHQRVLDEQSNPCHGLLT
jgi:hypothetical protein